MCPIEGLSDVLRMPRLGKIHLGEKVTSKGGQEIPKATHYFVFTDDENGEKLKKLYGEKPTELPVFVPVDEIDSFASQFYRCYSMTLGLICRGDGAQADRSVDTDTGDLANRDTKNQERKMVQCSGRECPDYQRGQCKEVMMLQVMLPDFPGIGVWQIDTSSINSIININSEVRLYKAIYGTVRMLPLMLTLEPQETKDKNGKRRTVYCLHLRSKATLKELKGEADKTRRELLPAPTPILPVADDETPAEVDVVEALDEEAEDEEVRAKEKAEAEAKAEKAKKAEEAEAEKPPEPPKPPEEKKPKPTIDTAWLTDNLQAQEVIYSSLIEVLSAKYGVEKRDNVMDTVDQLDADQTVDFFKFVENGCPGVKRKRGKAQGPAPAPAPAPAPEPEDKVEKGSQEAPTEPPSNMEELNKLIAHHTKGKGIPMTEICKITEMTDEEIKRDPAKAWEELKTLKGWLFV